MGTQIQSEGSFASVASFRMSTDRVFYMQIDKPFVALKVHLLHVQVAQTGCHVEHYSLQLSINNGCY